MNSLFFCNEENREGAAEFRRCMPVNVTTSYRVLAPALAQAEQNWIRPVLGDALTDALADYYATRANDGGDGAGGRDDAMRELLEMVQMADVRIALWDSYDQLMMNMGESGASPVVDAEKRPYRYESDNLRRSLEQQGMRCLDNAARFAEAHIDVLTEYAESDYYSVQKQSMIHDCVVFDRIIPINKSVLLFNRIRPFIHDAEELELGYRLGGSLAELLLKGEEKRRMAPIAEHVRRFVAHWAYAEACVCLNIVPTELGLMRADEKSTSQGGTGRALNSTEKERVDALVAQERQRAERYMSAALDYIKRHLEAYPEAEEIGGEFMATSRTMRRDNRGQKMVVI